ncbi:unnamed protein product [Somion occarium]
MYDHVLDATRSCDGCLVLIKVVDNGGDEIETARYLSSPELVRNPANHCVPIMDFFLDPLNSSQTLMVMPYLRPFDDPEFGTIGEVVDFLKQTLEGLFFMHSHGVAHRDCAAGNIMMDGRPLYPHGHHPVRLDYAPDAIHDVHPLSRIDNPVKYYFIDFGISSRFRDGEAPYVLGTEGRDKDPPELSLHTPYNAFMLDMYVLGNVYQKEFLDKYHGLEFLQPLVSSMLQDQPEGRPTAEAANMAFQKIRLSLNDSILRWRLRSRFESAPERVVYDTLAVAKEGIYHLKRLLK